VGYYLSSSAIDEDIVFSDPEYYCVLYADMVSSTETAVWITDSTKLGTFYGTFINSLSHIAGSFDSKVIKTGGDSIICYFPETRDCNNRPCFKKVLECGLEMIAARCKINSKLHLEGLPAISYRISADYGKHEVVKASSSNPAVRDLIGTTMNMCSKINSQVPHNSMGIGGDLYEIVKSSCPEFSFEGIGEYLSSLKNAYPVYSVSKRKEWWRR
jgi:class 3 adenylate cyclase